jgi:hypothetical protein
MPEDGQRNAAAQLLERLCHARPIGTAIDHPGVEKCHHNFSGRKRSLRDEGSSDGAEEDDDRAALGTDTEEGRDGRLW